MAKAAILMVSDFDYELLKDYHFTIFSRCIHDVVSEVCTYFALGI
jgi:hypothetical protein